MELASFSSLTGWTHGADKPFLTDWMTHEAGQLFLTDRTTHELASFCPAGGSPGMCLQPSGQGRPHHQILIWTLK